MKKTSPRFLYDHPCSVSEVALLEIFYVFPDVFPKIRGHLLLYLPDRVVSCCHESGKSEVFWQRDRENISVEIEFPLSELYAELRWAWNHGYCVLHLLKSFDVSCNISPEEFDEFDLQKRSDSRKPIRNNQQKSGIFREIVGDSLREALLDEIDDLPRILSGVRKNPSHVGGGVVRVRLAILGSDGNIGSTENLLCFRVCVAGHESHFQTSVHRILRDDRSMLPSRGAIDNDHVHSRSVQSGPVIVFVGKYDILPVIDDPNGVLRVPGTDDNRFMERKFRNRELRRFGEKLQSSEDYLVEVRDIGFVYLSKSVEIFWHGSRSE